MAVTPSPGSPPGSAPNKLLTILGDQPMGEVRQDNRVYPSMAFVQMMQRIISYLGQPVTSGAGAGGTVSQNVSDALSAASFAAYGPGLEGIATSTQDRYIITGFPPNGPSGPGTGGVVLQQGTVTADGTVEVGDLLVLTPTSLQGEIWAPLVNGDPPGADLIGYPDGQVKGPTLMSLPNGTCIMVRIR